MSYKACAHCGKRFEVGGSLFRDGVDYSLCHPDEGLDCYRLVTVYGEEIGSRKDKPDLAYIDEAKPTDLNKLDLSGMVDGETRVFLLSGQDTSKWEHIFKGFKNG